MSANYLDTIQYYTISSSGKLSSPLSPFSDTEILPVKATSHPSPYYSSICYNNSMQLFKHLLEKILGSYVKKYLKISFRRQANCRSWQRW